MPLLSCRVCENSGRAAGQLASSWRDCGMVAAFRVLVCQKEQKSGAWEIAWVAGKINRHHCPAPRMLFGLLAPLVQPGRQTHSSTADTTSSFWPFPGKVGMHNANCPAGVKNLVNAKTNVVRSRLQLTRFVKIVYIWVCEGTTMNCGLSCCFQAPRIGF